jgi:hypothetical protein
MRYTVAAVALIAGGLCTACSQGVTRSRRGDKTVGVSAATVVTAAELRRVGQGRSVFAALEQARPWFLAARGGVPAVSLDGASPTDVSVLRSISVSDVCEVQLLRTTSGPGRSAVMTDGEVKNGGDVLLVLTRTDGSARCKGAGGTR